MKNSGHALLSGMENAPVLVTAGSEGRLTANLTEVAQNPHYAQMLEGSTALAANSEAFWDEDSWEATFRPYVVVNGVLQVQVTGVLLHRFPYQLGRYATGYAYIERAIRRGLEDENVKGIALMCDTPGGEVSGCFELSEFIYGIRDEKPIRAFAADAAYSAGYALASAAESITVTRSGGVGSVGVLTMHVDYSGSLSERGIKVTMIYAGKHKVDGNPYEALPDSVKERMQKRIDRIYGNFVSLVAQNRDMEEGAVRETEALTYDSSEAITVGFADSIGEIEEAMVSFQDEVTDMENENMTTKPQNPSATLPEGTVTQAQMEAAVATATETATAAGALAENARIKSVLTSAEAKTRPALANSLLFNPKMASMSADDLTGMLSELPEEKAAVTSPEGNAAPAAPAAASGSKETPFNAAMASNNPNVGVETASGDDGNQTSASGGILNDLAAASGLRRKTA